MLVSEGYPGKYEKGKMINNLDLVENSLVFHAATKTKQGELLTNGGRVMSITSTGKNLSSALKKAYINANLIEFDNKFFRKDIGQDMLQDEVTYF